MAKIDPIWLAVLSELFVNLAAFWFGVAFLGSNLSGLHWPFNIVVLTVDLVFGIVCLVIAFRFRKRSKESK